MDYFLSKKRTTELCCFDEEYFSAGTKPAVFRLGGLNIGLVYAKIFGLRIKQKNVRMPVQI